MRLCTLQPRPQFVIIPKFPQNSCQIYTNGWACLPQLTLLSPVKHLNSTFMCVGCTRNRCIKQGAIAGTTKGCIFLSQQYCCRSIRFRFFRMSVVMSTNDVRAQSCQQTIFTARALLSRYMSWSCVCLSQVGVLLKWLNVGTRKQRHSIAQGL